ncbi:hypothetical protein Q9Q94_09695 [Uliginosibacterium sp. 31-16]|uniref:hypothetical protein n=1 Tax=Uliginosibacterium sp. 31-16 TaxID=3068315 RepID=UPI00273DA907|nr:hypothetical protein [Uliginosibacterium sp. 31-16]MDP5239805.1 hypothetical protein [Uliginosibacterium sp. 31-16]
MQNSIIFRNSIPQGLFLLGVGGVLIISIAKVFFLATHGGSFLFLVWIFGTVLGLICIQISVSRIFDRSNMVDINRDGIIDFRVSTGRIPWKLISNAKYRISNSRYANIREVVITLYDADALPASLQNTSHINGVLVNHWLGRSFIVDTYWLNVSGHRLAKFIEQCVDNPDKLDDLFGKQEPDLAMDASKKLRLRLSQIRRNRLF